MSDRPHDTTEDEILGRLLKMLRVVEAERDDAVQAKLDGDKEHRQELESRGNQRASLPRVQSSSSLEGYCGPARKRSWSNMHSIFGRSERTSELSPIESEDEDEPFETPRTGKERAAQ